MNNEPLRLAAVRAAAADGRARQLRLAARLSLADVGRACGVDQSTVYRWETGRRSPRGEAALRYEAFLRALEGRGSR
jgi:transcriptional regulator with XRE-family HTH domain